MPDLTRLDDSLGERLSLEEYRRDFRARQWTIQGEASWKLERAQHFIEPGFPSWDAFARGEWSTALRLLEDEREWLEDFMAEAVRKRIRLFRLRVVQEPLTPYLQWELHLLRLRAECGEDIRVADAEAVARYERSGPLPELVTLGASTLYRVCYDESGALDGAVRFSAPELVADAAELTSELFRGAETMESFFRRRVADLPPPRRNALTG
ncbi:hypothetical protein E1264_18020 [Actinomadura sp. KC216]|uniref:DUF6879 family protein n=1 Tax=Actinomadura sp. KC216 TaxID=2530370 RepID=UPI00104EFF9F|nr:DUF6879 family protein [Actinomadura sp. KC216]TDB86401.1 hypothetical protein E1264_18020 [Actinomadura sp. KC216]